MSTLKILLFQRLWQAAAGLVTVILISKFLSLELQGWYYGFLSIIALHAIFDLGLNLILSRKSAQLFIDLSWLPKGKLSGQNILQFEDMFTWAIRHYAKLSLLFLFSIVPIGYYFFSLNTGVYPLHWRLIWLILGCLGAMSISTIPFFALIEGSGDVQETSLVRLIQNVGGSLLCWFLLVLGFELWAVIAMPFVACLLCLFWLVLKRKHLFKLLFNHHKKTWYKQNNILPLHSKIAVSTISAYLIIQIYTPILFYYHGAIQAGKMGLSVTIAVMLGVLAQSWLTRSVPKITKQILIKNKALADQIFKKDFVNSTFFLIIGSVSVMLAYKSLTGTNYLDRILSFRVFSELLLTVIISHILNSLAIQLRCFADEPLVLVSFLGSIFTVVSALFAAPQYSAEGIILSILAVQLFFTLPISFAIWRKHNQNFFKSQQCTSRS